MLKIHTRLNAIAVFSLIALLTFSCEKEQGVNPNEGKVQFSFQNLSPTSDLGRAASESLRFLVISVDDLSGNSIFDKKKIELMTFGDTYLSEPLELKPGTFHLTEFLVLDESSIVRYATPLEGSPLAHLVNDPLPLSFDVAKDQVTKVVPQVVTTEDLPAEDFGYATFSLDVVDILDFNIGVFIFNDAIDNLEMTTSTLTVKAEDLTVLFDQSIPARTFQVVVKDGYDSYSLNITKDGYLPYSKSFTAAELATYSSNAVLKVILEPVNDYSLKFDGVDDYLAMGNLYDDINYPITIGAWIQVDPTLSYIGPIFVSQDDDEIYNGFWFAVTTQNLFFEYGDGLGQNHYIFRRGKSSIGNDMTSHWIYVTGVCRAQDDISLYINGVDVGGEPQGGSSNPMNSDYPNALATIGRLSTNGIYSFFKGYMDDVTIWNRTLTPGEISEMMTHKFTGTEAGLVGHWNFNEPAGDAVLDASPFEYNGTIKNGATRVVSTAPND